MVTRSGRKPSWAPTSRTTAGRVCSTTRRCTHRPTGTRGGCRCTSSGPRVRTRTSPPATRRMTRPSSSTSTRTASRAGSSPCPTAPRRSTASSPARSPRDGATGTRSTRSSAPGTKPMRPARRTSRWASGSRVARACGSNSPTARSRPDPPTVPTRPAARDPVASPTPTSDTSPRGPKSTPTGRSGSRPSGSSVGNSVPRSPRRSSTRAMELSPQAPTFVDMRNAILVADAAIFGSAHHGAIWQVFASRGMGFFASATDTFDTDPVADFSTPVDCPGPGCGSLSGRVTDPSGGGAPVAGALVRVAGSELGVPVDLSVMTGPDGRFHIPDVPDGLYRDVEVSLDGYATRTFAHVRVDGAATMRIILRARLGLPRRRGLDRAVHGARSHGRRRRMRPGRGGRRLPHHQLAHVGRPSALPHDPPAAAGRHLDVRRGSVGDLRGLVLRRQGIRRVDPERRGTLGARLPHPRRAPRPSAHAGPPASRVTSGHTACGWSFGRPYGHTHRWSSPSWWCGDVRRTCP